MSASVTLPRRPSGRRGTLLPEQTDVPAVEEQPSSWSPRLDQVAEAIAEADGYIWNRLNQNRREHWRLLAAKVLQKIGE